VLIATVKSGFATHSTEVDQTKVEWMKALFGSRQASR
jgi:hypothetical protein